MSTTNTDHLAAKAEAHLAAMDPDQLAAGLAAALATREAHVLAEHADVPTVPIAEEDRPFIVEALESEVEAVGGLFCLQGADGELDPFAAHEHLDRYLPLLVRAREGRAIVSEATIKAMAAFSDSWRQFEGWEVDDRTLRRIDAYERVGADVAAALTGASGAGRPPGWRTVSVALDEAATRAAVVAVAHTIHYAADELMRVSSPWSDTTPGDLDQIGRKAQRIARLTAFGDRLGWTGDRACTFVGTEGELLDLAVVLGKFANEALSASRHATEPTATDDRALSAACTRASRLLAGLLRV